MESLRAYYGLEKRPVKIIEPFQMLGEIDEELKQIMHLDCEHVFGSYDMLGNDNDRLHTQRTPWGQEVLIAQGIDLTPDRNNDVWLYPQGDRTAAPSAVLSDGCYFMNAIERCGEIDDSQMNPEDNLEEYGLVSDEELDRFAARVETAARTGRAVVASFGGSALGDVAFVPGVSLRNPKGIRSVAEWYISTLMRPDYIREVFSRQTDFAIANYRRLWERCGDKIDVVFTCGTDFGTQNSQFCSPETFHELWLPYYKRLNDWDPRKYELENLQALVRRHVSPARKADRSRFRYFQPGTDQRPGHGLGNTEKTVRKTTRFLGREVSTLRKCFRSERPMT